MREISSSASLGQGVVLDVDRLRIGPNVVIDDGVTVSAREAQIGEGAHLARGVTIEAEHFSAGRRSRIEAACHLAGLRGRAEAIELGDHFFLGQHSTAAMPALIVGDFVSLHNHLLANGLEPCHIGHNAWIGQNCVLNSNKALTIGNNVGIGAYSSIYTHGFFGELLEGCEIFNEAPVSIEDDAWLVGAYNVVSPGVTIGRRAVVLSSSVVTADVPPERCFGGSPAVDLTDRIPTYRAVTPEEKLSAMRGFVAEYVHARFASYETTPHGFSVKCDDDRTRVVEVRKRTLTDDFDDDVEGVVYVAEGTEQTSFRGVTVFDLTQKTYRKLSNDFEAEAIRFMNSYRARFVPADRPRIDGRSSPDSHT